MLCLLGGCFHQKMCIGLVIFTSLFHDSNHVDIWLVCQTDSDSDITGMVCQEQNIKTRNCRGVMSPVIKVFNKPAPISIERVDSLYLSTNSSVICLLDGQKIIVKTITNVTNPYNNDNKGKGCFEANSSF